VGLLFGNTDTLGKPLPLIPLSHPRRRLSGVDLVAVRVTAAIVPQVPIGGLGIDVEGDPVTERAAADVVDLVDCLPAGGIRAVLGVGRDLVDEAGLDGPVLLPHGRLVPDAAEGEGLLGAVLAGRAVTSIQEATEAVVAVAIGVAGRIVVIGLAAEALVRVLEEGRVARAEAGAFVGAGVAVDGDAQVRTGGPEGLGVGYGAGGWWRVIRQDGDGDGDDGEEEALEGNHDVGQSRSSWWDNKWM